MTKLRRLSIVMAGCILASAFAGGVSAQPRMDRDWDQGRDWQDRGPDRERDWRDRDRDRDWDRGRRWRDRDCYYETRRERNRFGDLIVRRYRVCED
jgi:Ni/Co efflux regulator RcnB